MLNSYLQFSWLQLVFLGSLRHVLDRVVDSSKADLISILNERSQQSSVGVHCNVNVHSVEASDSIVSPRAVGLWNLHLNVKSKAGEKSRVIGEE